MSSLGRFARVVVSTGGASSSSSIGKLRADQIEPWPRLRKQELTHSDSVRATITRLQLHMLRDFESVELYASQPNLSEGERGSRIAVAQTLIHVGRD